MDRLWTPWRFPYISQPFSGHNGTDCVLCSLLQAGGPQERFLLYRGPACFVVLNLFPYTVGHLMISPVRHIPFLTDLQVQESLELMDLAKQSQNALAKIYHPEGFNLGMNMGSCAGAGVAGHLHLHLVPRWSGDSNFMTVIGETRVLPETLLQTYHKLLPFFSPSP